MGKITKIISLICFILGLLLMIFKAYFEKKETLKDIASLNETIEKKLESMKKHKEYSFVRDYYCSKKKGIGYSVGYFYENGEFKNWDMIKGSKEELKQSPTDIGKYHFSAGRVVMTFKHKEKLETTSFALKTDPNGVVKKLVSSSTNMTITECPWNNK